MFVVAASPDGVRIRILEKLSGHADFETANDGTD